LSLITSTVILVLLSGVIEAKTNQRSPSGGYRGIKGMAQNTLYNIMVEIHSNMCDCHRRTDVECITEEVLRKYIPQDMTLEEAFAKGWEEAEEREDSAYWRYIYSIEEYIE
jgi:hypothetical protein